MRGVSNRRVQERISLLVFLAPTLAFVFVFIAFPILFSGYLSFSEYDYAQDDSPRFIGLEGYRDMLFEDSLFHTALVNQFKFAIPYFTITFVVSLGLAIIVGELTRGIQLFQIIFYLPMIIPMSLVGIAFTWILSPDLGILNHILRTIGRESWAKHWFGNPNTALYGLVMARSWKMIGFTFIVFLSGVQAIPRSLREAAEVDGASFVQEVWYVVIPLLRPYLLAGGIWITINSIKVFTLPHMVTQGGPGVSTLTLYLYSWKAAFQRYDMGLASRIAYFTALIILILAWALNIILKPESAERF